MADYDVRLYVFDPLGVFSGTVGNTVTYSGPATAAGTATISDTQSGIDGLVLDDAASETAVATTTISGNTVAGTEVYAEESWTLRDVLTGQEFQLVTFRVNSGANIGYYTLSEFPLIVGRDYETVSYDTVPDASIGDAAFSYADYSDGIVEGTDGDDVIDTDYTGDPGGDVIDGNDNPTQSVAPIPLEFNWSDYVDEQDLRAGVTQDTGGIDVAVSYADVQTTDEFTAELSGGANNSVYVAPGEPFDPNSSANIFAFGDPDNTTLTFDFSPSAGAPFAYEAINVAFRISDIDGLDNGTSDFFDLVTVRAFDADGNEIEVTVTPGTNVGLADGVVSGALINTTPSSETGSALFEIAGPVASITIEYGNAGTSQQQIFISDLHFEAQAPASNDDIIQAGAGADTVDAGLGDDQVFGEAGSDTLSGGAGADTLDGGADDDVINLGGGDTAQGGTGDDAFIIDDTLLDGNAIVVDGGEGDEDSGGDTLDFNGALVSGSIVYSSTTPGDLAGTATLSDGSTLTFSDIESVICFAAGTRIATGSRSMPVETLRPGDLVLTRDNGLQPLRWVGARKVAGSNHLAPIEFAPGALGNKKLLRVSPQHRMLIGGHRAQLLCGETEILVAAKHLVNGRTIRTVTCPSVSYHHLLFDTHKIVKAEDIWSESYQPGAASLPGLDERAREELFEIFPELRLNPSQYGPSARSSVTGAIGRLLAA